jgi:hypothetical protein
MYKHLFALIRQDTVQVFLHHGTGQFQNNFVPFHSMRRPVVNTIFLNYTIKRGITAERRIKYLELLSFLDRLSTNNMIASVMRELRVVG